MEPQLTVRAVIIGSLLGLVLSITNVYLGLKVGLHLGVNLTACVLAHALGSVLRRVQPGRSPLSLLETATAVSVASSGGYATGNTLVSAFPAMLLVSATPALPQGMPLSPLAVGTWVLLVAAYGVVVAVVMKRTLLDREDLPFPSGTAAAATLQSYHADVAERAKRIRALLVAAAVSAIASYPVDVIRPKTGDTLLPDTSPIFDVLPFRTKPSEWGLGIGNSLMLVAAGALIGLRVTAWMLVGQLVILLATPAGMAWTWVNPAGKTVAALPGPDAGYWTIGTWGGASVIVASSLVALVAQRRSILGALRSLRHAEAGAGADEVPLRWFLAGLAVTSLGLLVAGRIIFGIPVPFGLLALALAFVLAIVSCRIVGETDLSAPGPLGKLVQLTFGAVRPGNALLNLEAASITAGAALASGDLLNDLKMGKLLRASPRRQFLAQALGILAGTAGSVGAFFVLVPDATVLGGRVKAPSAKTWSTVALLLRDGVNALHPMLRWAIALGLVVGLLLAIVERTAARRWASSFGLGLGMLLPFPSVLSLFVGAALAALVSARRPSWAERYLVVIAAGAITGEALVGTFGNFLAQVLH